MPNTNHHQPCCGTDNNLGLIAAIAQDLWTHHQSGATRDQCITEAINIFENNPNAAAIAGTAIWLYATTINRDDDDIDGKTEPAPAADREFGRYRLDIRYSPRDAFISLACDGREVATYSSGTPVAVIVDRILKDMEPAEPEPVPPPGIVHGTISGPDGRLEIIVAPDWFDHLGSPPRLLRAHQMREQAAALLRLKPDLAGKTIDVTFDPEDGVLRGWKLSEDGKAAGDENPFVDAGAAAVFNEFGRDLAKALQGSFGSVDAGAVAAEMAALSGELDAAGEALKTPQDELAARLDQIRTGEIRFPDSWKQPMPKLAEGGVIKSGEPYLAGEGNVAPQKDSEPGE